uniref:Uncharacterized protein n=1 Tax=Amphimedon queenslandica TaxID=400682 RepID=A0A1X7VP37_AMPQE
TLLTNQEEETLCHPKLQCNHFQYLFYRQELLTHK